MTFQKRVQNWLMACFSMEICRDTIERNHRFLEESLELVQSLGCTQSEAHQLVGYVYGRPVGEPAQEVGGVLNTLAALCSAADLDMDECGEIELARVWTKIDKIRAKQAAKPKHSPLLEHVSPRIHLADHDAIGRMVLGQPWAIQAAIVTITAHCTVLVDKYPDSDAADLAGCISESCLELAKALKTAALTPLVTPHDGSGA